MNCLRPPIHSRVNPEGVLRERKPLENTLIYFYIYIFIFMV